MSTSMQYIAKTTVERAAKNVAANIYIELMRDEEHFIAMAQTYFHRGGDVELALAADMREALK